MAPPMRKVEVHLIGQDGLVDNLPN